MWYLHCLNDSIIYLWEKDAYSVGRKNKDIIIENDDSISRNHGIFKIKDNDLYLTDLGSKYGTFVGTSKLPANEEKKLSVNEIVTFGLLQNHQSKFKIKKLDFKIILSNVKSNEKHDQYTAIQFLKVTKTNIWDTFCTHVVVSEVILTSKVLCALTMDQHIVNVKFFPDYVQAVKTNSKPPNESDYKPEFNETLLNKDIKLEFHPDRKTLFKDVICIFLTEKSKKSVEEVISTTGGKVLSWQNQAFSIDKLKINTHRYLFIEDHSEDINKESKTYKSFQEAIKFIQSTGRRSIPLQEIALAIIHNSREQNCNSSFNRAALLVPPDTQEEESEIILAYDTEHSSNSNPKTQSQNSLFSEIQSVVEPSFDTGMSMLSGVKRSLEIDLTVNEAEKSSKKAKEDQPSTSTQFFFRKPSNQTTVAQSKLDKFLFTRKNTSTQPDTNKVEINEVSETANNPFSRKRKATNNINTEAKKRPLENISNLQLEKTKINTVTTEKNNETTFNRSIVPVKNISVSKYQSTSWIKKEVSFNENIIKKEETEDEEICKLNEMFKDSIIIDFCIVARRQTTKTSQNNTGKNFKNFKKIHQNIQSEIICDFTKVVVGDSSILKPDEEEYENDDMDNENHIFDLTPKNRKQQRRRFQFST